MKEQETILNPLSETSPWVPVVASVVVVLASLIYIPVSWGALNSFDPPKHFLFAFVSLILAVTWRYRANRFSRTPLFLVFGLLAWIVGRSLLKSHPSVELEVLFTWILPVLLFIVASGIEQAKGARIFAGLLVIACLIQAGIMVLQRFGLDPFFSASTSCMDYKPGRMVGTIGYQNQAVDFLALSATGILIIGRTLILRLAFMLTVFIVAGLTGNRGGIVAFASAFLISQFFSMKSYSAWRPRRSWIIAVGVLIGAIVIFGSLALIPETNSRFQELLTDTRSSPAVSSRQLMARVGLDQLKDKPWIGWGAGEYAFQYLDRLGNLLPVEKTHEVLRQVVFARETHNDYLQFAVEFGIMGVTLVAALGIVAFVRCTQARSAETVPAMVFILIYMGVSALVSFPWQTSMGGPLAGLLLGWLWPRGDEDTLCRMGICGGARARLQVSIAKTILLSLSLILVGWYSCDMYLNIVFPQTLARSGPAEAERLLPHYSYRYHALVGAAYSTRGDNRAAERDLVFAQSGFRDVLLLNNLGHVQAMLYKWREAQQTYAKWARCGLVHSNALMNLSIAAEQAEQYRDASDALSRKIILWGPAPLQEIKRLVILQLKAGDARSAHDTISCHRKEWSHANSTMIAEFENLEGATWVILGDKNKAAELFRSAIEQNPKADSARLNLHGLTNSCQLDAQDTP